MPASWCCSALRRKASPALLLYPPIFYLPNTAANKTELIDALAGKRFHSRRRYRAVDVTEIIITEALAKGESVTSRFRTRCRRTCRLCRSQSATCAGDPDR